LKKEKERLRWEALGDRKGIKPRMKEWVGDGIPIIISMTVGQIMTV